jgi:hypothetical protein
MKKIIYLIILVLVISTSSICFADNSFESDSRAIYTELRNMGMNFDIGINYINFKNEFRKLYQDYNNYGDKYMSYAVIKSTDTPDVVKDKNIYNNVTSCFDIYRATNVMWMDDVSSRSNAMSKINWIWNEFPELQTLHRDWLGGYDTKKVMWIVLGYRQARENTLLNSINERYSKK